MAYITKSGDTWDMIAKEVYGSEYHADVLMAANAAHIGDFYLQAGVELSTPALGKERNGLLPPWKYEANYD
ncbi:MAG: phage tail protein [Oscillospiraceae bacterium]